VDSVRASVRASVVASVRASVRASVVASVVDSVWDSVRASVGDSVRASVVDSVRASVVDSVLQKHFNNYSSYFGWSNFGWVSFYDFFERIGVLDHFKFKEYKKLIKSNAFNAYEYEGFVFAIQPPTEIHRNESGQLHNTAGPAITFKDGSNYCFINGRSIPHRLFAGFSKEDFMNEGNEDIRGAMFEIIEAKGEGSMLAFLEAREYHSETVVHKNGDLEELTLYHTDKTFPELRDLNGKRNVPLCWLRLVCPSTGQQYLINTDASFKTASEAARFHRPEEVPFELNYTWSIRN
jgi:hypothetical protein